MPRRETPPESYSAVSFTAWLSDGTLMLNYRKPVEERSIGAHACRFAPEIPAGHPCKAGEEQQRNEKAGE
jgi:hypothetical protein